MMKNLFLIIVSGALTLTACKVSKDASNDVVISEEKNQPEAPTQLTKIRVVSKEEFRKMTESKIIVQLVDVRTKEEFDSGHIGGAYNIDFYESNFKANIDKLDKTQTLFIYCRSGGRSAQASELIKTMGFKEIIDLDGGYMNWIK